jgi:hypothetical protein
MTNDELNQIIWGEHQGVMSISPTRETILDQDPKSETYGQQIPNPNPEYRYQLNDRTWFEAKSFDGGKTFAITNGGTAIKPGEIKAAEGQTRQNVVGGNVVQQVYRGGDWIVDTSVAPKPWTTASTPNEGDARQTVVSGQIVTQVYRNGDWIIDPTTPPKPFDPRAAKEGDTRDTVVSGNVVRQVYRGGDWIIDPSVAPRPWDTTKPKEGDTRDNVISGQVVRQVFRGGDWVVDPSVAPRPYDPTKATPKEGDARETVVNGQVVTQVYRGGDWIVDPSVAPRPFDTTRAQPKEGDTRDTVISGQVVRQIYRGGDWVVDPSVAPKPFDPSKPVEGTTRQAIESGYNVTQTFSGGEWITTAIGTRATPQPRQQVTAPADQPYITQFDPNTNQTVTIPNPNYQPKTLADVTSTVGRLNQQMQAKSAELSKKIADGSLSNEQANAEWESWYAQNIESQRGTLETIQRQAAVEERRKEEEARRANLTAAQAAGLQASNIAQAERKNMVGPGWAAAQNAIMNAFQTGKGIQGNVDWAAATRYTAPTLSSVAERATAQYLQGISPTAAGILGGQPNMLQQPLDIATALSGSRYRPAGTFVPVAQNTVVPPQPAVPFNATTGTEQLAAQYQRQAAPDIWSLYNLAPYSPVAPYVPSFA